MQLLTSVENHMHPGSSLKTNPLPAPCTLVGYTKYATTNAYALSPANPSSIKPAPPMKIFTHKQHCRRPIDLSRQSLYKPVHALDSTTTREIFQQYKPLALFLHRRPYFTLTGA